MHVPCFSCPGMCACSYVHRFLHMLVNSPAPGVLVQSVSMLCCIRWIGALPCTHSVVLFSFTYSTQACRCQHRECVSDIFLHSVASLCLGVCSRRVACCCHGSRRPGTAPLCVEMHVEVVLILQ